MIVGNVLIYVLSQIGLSSVKSMPGNNYGGEGNGGKE